MKTNLLIAWATWGLARRLPCAETDSCRSWRQAEVILRGQRDCSVASAEAARQRRESAAAERAAKKAEEEREARARAGAVAWAWRPVKDYGHVPGPPGPRERGVGWVLLECRACGHRHPRWQGCGHPDCSDPRCSEALTRRRAREARKAAERRLGEGRRVGYWVLTLPAAWRWMVRAREFRLLRKAAFDVVAGVYRRATGEPGLLPYGIMAGHPVGEGLEESRSEPKPEEWHPHLNLLIPDAAPVVNGRGRSARILRMVGLPMWIEPEILSWAKEEWARRAARILGQDAPGRLVVHYSQRKTAQEVGHAYRYALRHWPSWRGICRVERFGAARLPLRSWRGVSVLPPTCEGWDPAGCPDCGADVALQALIAYSSGDENGPWIRPGGTLLE